MILLDNIETPPTFLSVIAEPIFGLLLNLFSIGYALYQSRESKHQATLLSEQTAILRNQTDALKEQEEKLEQQSGSLENIAGSLTTKYLGEYPFFVPQTIELLKRAKKEILIVCDYPCYSYFSDHEKWLDYSQVIQRKSTGNNAIPVTIKFLDETKRRELMALQFRYDENNPDSWKKPEEIKKHLDNLIRLEKSEAKSDTITFTELQNIIEGSQKSTMNTFFRHATLMETSNSLPLYYWIIDDTEAIFSIPSFSDYDKEKGFYSSDTKLISALKTGQSILNWRVAIA